MHAINKKPDRHNEAIALLPKLSQAREDQKARSAFNEMVRRGHERGAIISITEKPENDGEN
jgi:pentatricopeptide repeat protein